MKTTPFLLALVIGILPLRAEERTVIFADDFENRSELGSDYYFSAEWSESFQVADGVLRISQVNPDHGAVMRRDSPFRDLDLEFDFRFSGGLGFNVVINDQRDKTVHSGHICRVSITPQRLTIGDDKTGSMNLEVRGQRLDQNLPPETKAALDALLAAKQSSAAVDLKPGEWRHARIRIEGDTMEAWIDGVKVASLNSPGIGHPTKTSFGFTVRGAGIDYDNLKVFEVEARASN